MNDVKILKECFKTDDILYSPDKGYIINGEGDYEIVKYMGSRYLEYFELEFTYDREELIYLINKIQPDIVKYINWEEYYEDNYTLEDFGWIPFKFEDNLYYIKKF